MSFYFILCGAFFFSKNLWNGVTEAHEEMATLDVLVCGQCHSAFHFLEEFREHKEANNCIGKSPVRDSVSTTS